MTTFVAPLIFSPFLIFVRYLKISLHPRINDLFELNLTHKVQLPGHFIDIHFALTKFQVYYLNFNSDEVMNYDYV